MQKIFFVLICLSLLAGCNSVDDQTVVVPERWSLGNPTPDARDFVRISQQHKILVGIIDAGVDYNQPLLFENLHFHLDAAGKPVGFGYDFTGQDAWASPYVIRTSDLNPDMDEDKKESSAHERGNTLKFIAKYPEFADVLSPFRNIAQEAMETAYHGTHVAGLASYDRPDIGVIGYRALPFNEKYSGGVEVEENMGDVFADTIVKASLLAIADGVRVINMSLGMDTDKPVTDSVKDAAEFANQKMRVEKLRGLALANPSVVFVVAAGNDSKWIDADSRLGLPCGVQAPNILCVGALDRNGQVASFSNLLVSEGAFIMTYGVEVLSTVPTKMCTSGALRNFGNDNYFTTEGPIAALHDQIVEDCSNLGLKKLSGTSMASPIMARQAAKILVDHPDYSGAQAIAALMALTEEVKVGKLVFQKLKIEKPSWYKTWQDQGDWMNKKNDEIPMQKLEPDTFEFFAPKK